MVTLIKYGALSGGEKYNVNVLSIDGLSTDTKPIGIFIEHGSDGREVGRMGIPNGSIFTEIDTGDTYMYDADNTTWYQVTIGGGGGSTRGLSSKDIGAMTNYVKAQTGAAIATTDTLNQAIGKVEKRVEVNENNILSEQGKTVGMTAGGSNYITVGGIRVYVSATAPTGDIPDGSVGVGW